MFEFHADSLSPAASAAAVRRSTGAAAGSPPPSGDPTAPPVVGRFNSTGPAPVLVLCDHATAYMPPVLGRLGLDPGQLGLHIAYDIGAADAARRLALRLDAPLLLAGWSRLIVDPNRDLDDPTLIPPVSDGVIIPGNCDLDPAERARRIAGYFDPYHRAIAAAVAGFRARGVAPAVISVHSFTPEMDGCARPWQIGILWDHDPRLPVPLLEALRRRPGLCIGDNLPYTGQDTTGGSIESHATPAGLPNVLLEFRQDLIDTAESAGRWADLVADDLLPILADPGLYRVEHHPRAR
ncbi:MAG: N-formylglutamate amidohydrolase [Azospirillum sp.]|nr:N-formylglutamate amidohydrolase [Azospirillum sp.]